MYRITKVLSVGPFPQAERSEALLAAGVTHVLNLCDWPSEVVAKPGAFVAVESIRLSDSRRLLPVTTVKLLNTVHKFAALPDSHVYVHCVMGMKRSPTVLWLYLIAMGVPPDDARDWIEERSPVAVAGHPEMVDHEHVRFAQMHGLANFFPHPRAEIVVPFDPV